MAVSAPSAVAPPTSQYQYGGQYPESSQYQQGTPQYQYQMNGQYQQYPAGSYGQQYPGMATGYQQEVAPAEGWDAFVEGASNAWEKTKVGAELALNFSAEAYKVAKDVTDKAIEVDREHNISGKVGHAAYVGGQYAWEGAKFIGTHAQRLDNQHNITGKVGTQVKSLAGKAATEIEKRTGPLSCCSQQQLEATLKEEDDIAVRGVSGSGI